MATAREPAIAKEKVHILNPDHLENVFGLSPMIKPFTTSRVVPIQSSCPQLLYGVELELENARYYPDWTGSGYSFHEDNSLRNSGIELITQPMTLSFLNYVLTLFFEKSGVTTDNYSERTSVHVHANCRDMTLDQVSVLALLYQVFELALFRWIGDERDKNIFCVPWYETTLSYNIVNSLNKVDHGVLKQWQKYTALNLLPLYKYGTVEFRHMAGTCDKDRIINWCNLIGCLFTYAKNHTLEDAKNWIIDLNTTSAYRSTLDTVFREWADILRVQEYKSLLEEGVLNMKYTLLSPGKVTQKIKTSSINEMMLAMQTEIRAWPETI